MDAPLRVPVADVAAMNDTDLADFMLANRDPNGNFEPPING